MHWHIKGAMADAMARLKTSDVAGATAAIRQALAARTRGVGVQPTSKKVAADDDAGAPRLRRLGDILKTLGAQRATYRRFPPASDEATPAADEGDDRFVSRSHRSAAGLLNYKLYVPANLDRELALVVMLHGCTQDPDDFARGTQMNRLADEFGLIVAYPHQPRSGNAQGCWNWFDIRHQQAGSGEPAMLAALGQELAREFKITPGRVFAAGLSAGAAMAEVLAETHPTVFAAVGLHSGLPYRAAHDVISAFAAMKGNGKTAPCIGVQGRRKIIIHGTADATVSRSNGDALFERMRSQNPGSSVVMSEVRSGSRTATRQVLIGPAGEALAEYLLINGAGHAWSGGHRSGTFADPAGPDASREMITFFLR
ncbi:extracellular catalytic domain type 1 short-chain-length polyhydroxyalkanoate depolymerase [Bosea lathyri]|uniref:Esterase, PHB depolymerase family n=1 Tax=Bosea lathyri TaxID=1036778 RepID=A0A1H6C718_9HYPH|nr:PHB depolymerase family esterase [Bosea lathyri]SEG68761.1 esterase, PHB depolymerase family [Bosea lathyri]